METEGIRQRPVKTEGDALQPAPPQVNEHPGGDVRYGPVQQVVRVVTLNLYFLGCCVW